MDPAMRIGQLAKRAGVAASALRYYEEVGLLAPAERTDSGYRMYGGAALGRLGFIKRAQALGLSVREIRDLVRSPQPEPAGERENLRHLVAHRLAETESRLAELSALSGELRALYVRLLRAPGPECGHVGDCACWLPTQEEVMIMAEDACCSSDCCTAVTDCAGSPDCACGPVCAT